MLFEEITNSQCQFTLEPSTHKLMKDVFGNYVVQKMFEFGSNSQRKALFSVIKNHIITLSSDQYGCRVIQKALESLPSNLRDEIVEEIKPDIIRCVEDANGNHVI